MARTLKTGLCFASALLLAGASVGSRAPQRNRRARIKVRRAPRQRSTLASRQCGGRPAAPAGEAHPGPKGYNRVAEPDGWNKRPATVDRGSYQHNFKAARTYHIGPYPSPGALGRAPLGLWPNLCRAPTGSPVPLLADYWLFGLEGCPRPDMEWVRDDDDRRFGGYQ